MTANREKNRKTGGGPRWREPSGSKERVKWKTLSVRVPEARMPEIHRARIALTLSCDAYMRRKIFEELPVMSAPINLEAWGDFRTAVRAFAEHADYVAAHPSAEIASVESALKVISDDLHEVLQRLFNVPDVVE